MGAYLLQQLADLWVNKEDADVSLHFYRENDGGQDHRNERVSLGEPVLAHKLVLKYSSVDFEARLNRKTDGVDDKQLFVPLHCAEEVQPTLNAIEYAYTGRVTASSIFSLLQVRRQADYLGLHDCVRQCERKVLERLQAASGSSSPLSPLVELYSCQGYLPFACSLRAACLAHLGRHWEGPLPPTPGCPTKRALLLWLVGDAVALTNTSSRELYAAFLALPATVMEELLAADDFASDNEATVLWLLDDWQRHNTPVNEVSARLTRLIRLTQLGSAYLTYMATVSGTISVTTQEALFALHHTQSSPEYHGETASWERPYDLRSPRYAGPRQQAIPAEGRRFGWRLPREEVKKLARAADEETSFAVRFDTREDGTAVVAYGFPWQVRLSHRTGDECCRVLLRGYSGPVEVGYAGLNAAIAVYTWAGDCKSGALEVAVAENEDPVPFGAPMELPLALPLRPPPAEGAAAGPVDPLARWADYLTADGCMTGSLTIAPPGRWERG